jgi:hypothetical protein
VIVFLVNLGFTPVAHAYVISIEYSPSSSAPNVVVTVIVVRAPAIISYATGVSLRAVGSTLPTGSYT